jgi:hypothetical protein
MSVPMPISSTMRFFVIVAIRSLFRRQSIKPVEITPPF